MSDPYFLSSINCNVDTSSLRFIAWISLCFEGTTKGRQFSECDIEVSSRIFHHAKDRAHLLVKPNKTCLQSFNSRGTSPASNDLVIYREKRQFQCLFIFNLPSIGRTVRCLIRRIKARMNGDGVFCIIRSQKISGVRIDELKNKHYFPNVQPKKTRLVSATSQHT